MSEVRQQGLPTRQHTVSKVVLRQFAINKLVSVFDREKDAFYTKGPRGVFWDNLDQHDPVGAERRWGAVEKDLPRVYRLIRNRSVLDDAAAVDTLRGLLALHWIRTPALREPHEGAKARVAEASMAKLAAQPERLAAAFQRRTGAPPQSSADLDWINRRLHDEVLSNARDEWLSGSLARLFAGALEFVAKQHIQVGYAAGTDFMIGDAPVVTTKAGHGGVGFHQGVALGDAIEMSMPIAPDILVAAAPAPALLDMDDVAVARYNQLQAQSFVRYLGAKPGGVSAQIIRDRCGARNFYE